MTNKEVALIGNPNSGKTTLFNALTGSSQQTGNWPGVTVEKKVGTLLGHDHIQLIDLPGTYSLGEYSEDELVAKRYLIDEKPQAVIDVIDASNLKRNLYLTTLLLEMGENVVLAVNMLDAAKKRNADVDVAKLSQLLNAPAVATVAVKNKGISVLADAVKRASQTRPDPFRLDYGNEIEHHLCKWERLLCDQGLGISNTNARFVAIKLLENNRSILKRLIDQGMSQDLQDRLKKDHEHLESIFREDVESVMIEKRYGFIEGIVKQVIRKEERKDRDIQAKMNKSEAIDRVVLNRYLSIPIFLAIMFLMFQLTFTFGGLLASLFEEGMASLGSLVGTFIAHDLLRSFLVDGVIGGLGSILVFIPNIFLLFFVLSILEDSGYMARGAYLMDAFMRKLGLPGKSFIPMITGFGCTVPAVMATRTLESKSDKMITMMILPFISCGAKLPVYVLFASAFFPKRESLVAFSLYLLGIVVALVLARVFRKTLFKGDNTPFVMELPPYRIPTLRGLFIHMWDRGSEFLKKAGTLIFSVIILIWVLSHLPYGVEYASQSSLIGQIGGAIAPIFKPLGFGSWEASTALLFGIVAKEVVVATLGTVYAAQGGLVQTIQTLWSPLAAYSFMIMTLLYTPCIATLATIRRESGSVWWMIFSIVYTFIVAWLLAFVFYQLASYLPSLLALLGLGG